MPRDVENLVRGLISQPSESEWFEFKVNQEDPESIGKYVSAISNSTMLADEQEGFLVFGVQDQTHEIVGTDVRLSTKSVGNDSFLHWLNKRLSPSLHLKHKTAEIDGFHVEVLCIDPAYKQPVRFNGQAYIRIDSSLHPISQNPAKEEALWRTVSRFTFEDSVASTRVSEDYIERDFFYGRPC